jgi:uncharacterized protein (TIGR00299 family) protein
LTAGTTGNPGSLVVNLPRPIHVHLDPVGGVAGDMFVAALLHAWPDFRDGTFAAIAALDLPSRIDAEVTAGRDHGLTGMRFEVSPRGDGGAPDHVAYRRIRDMIAAAPLAPGVIERAVDIFAILAEVEGRVHGIPDDQVTFHELGAADSIADIVAAAYLIEAVGAGSWSCGPLPMGAGRVASAHGLLPVPAPAVTLLLEGFALVDDGLDGERVTPTGAAILRHLAPEPRPPATPLRLVRSGTGLGTRRFPGISNMLRVLAFAPLEAGLIGERVAVIEFEVDDQTPEDLSLGLDRLRALAGVRDVIQAPAFGKKGRLAIQVRVLAAPEAVEPVAAACLTETRTLGLRWQIVNRAVLPRRPVADPADERTVRVKRAVRPDGLVTAKAEADDLADAGFVERDRRRRAAEDAALAKDQADE